MVQYDDNLVIFSNRNNVRDLSMLLNTQMDIFAEWLANNALNHSIPKSGVIFNISRRILSIDSIDVKFNSEIIPWVNSYKYLGVILAKNL